MRVALEDYKCECDLGREAAESMLREKGEAAIPAVPHVIRAMVEAHGWESGYVAAYLTSLAEHAFEDVRDRF